MAKIIYSGDDKYNNMASDDKYKNIIAINYDYFSTIRTFFTKQFPNIKSKMLQFESRLTDIKNQLSQLSWWQFIKRFRLNKQKKWTLNCINNYRLSYVNDFFELNNNFNSLDDSSKNKNNKPENLPEEEKQFASFT